MGKEKKKLIVYIYIYSIHKRNFFISIHNFVLFFIFYRSVVPFKEIYVMCFSICVNEFGLYGVIY